MKFKAAILILFFLIALSNAQTQDQKSLTYGIHPSIGLTYTNLSQSSNEAENLEWLLSLQANFNYAAENFNFDSDLFIQFGQIVAARQHPQKTQDNLILNLMPSVRLTETPSIRLFWQTKAETQMKEGFIGDQKAQFLDPLFLTHTLFVGDKNHLITQTEDQNFVIVYGIGYSFQQIIKRHFQLTSENQPSSNAEYIAGPTGVFNSTFSKRFSDLVSTSISLNSLLLAKKEFLKSTSNSRFSSLLTASLNLGVITLQYSNTLVYDKELSKKRQLNQSLVLGIKIDLG
jgi:hypothetical protein